MARHRNVARRSAGPTKRGLQPRMLAIAAVAAVALAAGLFAASGWLAPPTSTAPAAGAQGTTPRLVVSPAVYDLGQLSQAKGIVTVTLAVSNDGDADLVIREMETSCGCTRAALVVDGRTGPWFGMRGHGPWPVGWSARLRPDQQATLRVEYDPDAHGIYRGPIDRVVAIYSNDPSRPQVQVRLTGTQVP